MAMDYMSYLHHGYHHNNNMSPYDGPPHGQGGHHGYSYMYTDEQLYMMAHLQHRAMMGAGSAQGNGQLSKQPTDPKPRLSKDEVDLLEQEFQKNPKPSSGRKREIADHLKVDHPRINNWFQNRRAKEKQLKKAREFEAQQAADHGSSEPNSPDEDQEEDSVGEYFGSSNQSQPLQPSSAAFPTSIDVPNGHARLVAALPVDGSISPPTSSVDHEDAQSEQFSSPEMLALPVPVAHATDLDFSPVASSDFVGEANAMQQHLSCSNGMPLDGTHLDGMPTYSTNEHASFDKLNTFSHFGHGLGVESIIAPIPAFPSQLLIREHDCQDYRTESPLHHSSPTGLPIKPEPMSPMPTSMQSPNLSVDLRFKSPPPPSNLASRRNKGIPTLLNATALRSCSYGPKTGLDMTKHTEHASPMRRIASATGSFHGRIQKSSLASAPRSPLYLERTKEALMRSLQGAQSPMMASINTALSPVTPGGENHVHTFQAIREATASSSASDDEQRYTLGGSQQSFFRMETNLKTPPGTPGVVRGYPEQMLAIDSAWSYVPQDEPLITPSLGSFGSEEFSMAPSAPAYVVNSQPPTPSFAPGVGPTYFPWAINGNGNGAATHEYTFPGESYMAPDAMAHSSPGQTKLKQIQFTQNVTPQDFCVER